MSNGTQASRLQVEQKQTKPMSLIAQIREDYATHKRDWTLPGFRAVAIHRFGNWRMRVRPKLLRAPFSMLYRMMFRHVRNHYGIELPYDAKLGRRVRFDHQGGVVIHGNSVIGDDCVIRQGVTLGNRRPEEHDLAPTLGNGVSVGAGAKLLGPIKVGDNAIIGANSVVLIDVPAGRTVVGIPGRLLPQKDGQDKEKRRQGERRDVDQLSPLLPVSPSPPLRPTHGNASLLNAEEGISASEAAHA